MRKVPVRIPMMPLAGFWNSTLLRGSQSSSGQVKKCAVTNSGPMAHPVVSGPKLVLRQSNNGLKKV